MWPHSDVKEIFARICDHVLVGSDAGRLQRLARQLLPLVAYHVHS